jgi:hypothetical protein
MISPTPPGGNDTTTLIGLEGQACCAQIIGATIQNTSITRIERINEVESRDEHMKVSLGKIKEKIKVNHNRQKFVRPHTLNLIWRHYFLIKKIWLNMAVTDKI